MMHKDKLLLPAMLAAALAASPVLAQSTTPQGATGSTGGTTLGTSTGPGTGPGMGMGRGTGMGAGMHGWPADSVVMFRPRLSQLIGTNVYNDRNESIGEVDDIVLAAPTGADSTGTPPRPMSGATTGATTGTTTSPTTPGSATTGTATMPGMSAAGMQRGPMAVIQVGGFLGMGGRLVMVPLSELQWNVERERVIMPNASKELLQSRPAFTYDSLRRG